MTHPPLWVVVPPGQTVGAGTLPTAGTYKYGTFACGEPDWEGTITVAVSQSG
ncbi:MAG TPA: hypothetical protein VMH39_12020 [Gemmatimonadaceae bacterium]|nr:hypothetical protein [Gemmatimonadaceae bacterium]